MKGLASATTSFRFTIDSPSVDILSETIQWNAEVFAQPGSVSYGVSVTPDPGDPMSVTVAVDTTVVGDVLLKLGYTKASGEVVVAKPRIVVSIPPSGVFSGITLGPNGLEVRVGTKFNVLVQRSYSNGEMVPAFIPSDASGVFLSSDPSVLRVDGNNRLIAVSAGSAVLTASLDGFQTQATFVASGHQLPPIAVRDEVSAHATPITISVLANDTAINGAPLTLVSVTQPAHGLASISGNQVIYSPGTTFRTAPKDEFQYVVSDGARAATSGRVIITKQNSSPVAQLDRAVAGSAPVTVNVIANDTDGDGDPLSIAGIVQPNVGTAIILANGIQFSPPAGQWSRAEIPYTVADGFGGVTSPSLVIYRSGQDFDSDGQSNDVEIVAGTDPGDPSSSFRVRTLQKEGTGFMITWVGRPGAWFAVERSIDDFSSWQRISPWFPGTPTIMSHADTDPMQPGSFYRIVATTTDPGS